MMKNVDSIHPLRLVVILCNLLLPIAHLYKNFRSILVKAFITKGFRSFTSMKENSNNSNVCSANRIFPVGFRQFFDRL